MLLYAKEVADVVTRVVDEEGITRILLLGAQGPPTRSRQRCLTGCRSTSWGARASSSAPTRSRCSRPRREMADERARADQRSLWDRIRDEGLGNGLAVFGPGDVLRAAQQGRVETMVVTRDAKVAGMRCRDCETLAFAKPQQCSGCKLNSVFAVDLVNELVELLALSSAAAEFVEPLPGLSDAEDVAALLRY